MYTKFPLFPHTVPEALQYIKTAKNFDKCLRKINVISVEGGNCTAQLEVAEEHTNIMGGLHGGFSANIVDMSSSIALMSHKIGVIPSVSVDMHISYVRGAMLGDNIIIDAKTMKTGKHLAFLEVTIKRPTGELLVRGCHTKYFLHKD